MYYVMKKSQTLEKAAADEGIPAKIHFYYDESKKSSRFEEMCSEQKIAVISRTKFTAGLIFGFIREHYENFLSIESSSYYYVDFYLKYVDIEDVDFEDHIQSLPIKEPVVDSVNGTEKSMADMHIWTIDLINSLLI